MADCDVIATCNAEKFDKKIEAAENPAKHRAIEVRQAGYLQRSGSASFYANSTGYRRGLTEKRGGFERACLRMLIEPLV